jgi:hypothetical protein
MEPLGPNDSLLQKRGASVIHGTELSLIEAGVKFTKILPCKRRFHYDRRMVPERCILVLAVKQGEYDEDESWHSGIDRVLSLFKALGMHDLNVELVDVARATERREIYPIHWHGPEAVALARLEPGIYSALKDPTVTIPWVKFDVIRKGKSANRAENPLTIILTINYRAPPISLSYVKWVVLEVCRDAGMQDVCVEVVRGSIMMEF